MRKIAVSLLIAMLITSVSFAADFAPTLLKLSVDPIIQYDFGGSNLSIPVQVTGTTAGIIFCVYTRGEAANIENTINGNQGWHHVSKVDTCIYYSTMKSVATGANTITWDGKDQDGGVVPAGDYTYYMWAFDNQGTKTEMGMFLPSGWGFDYQTEIQAVDEAGLPMANPIWYRANLRWKIGNDPQDSALVEMTDISLAEGWGRRGDPTMQFDDFNYFYISIGNTESKTGSMHKLKWVPAGESEIQTDWGEGGYAETFSTAGGGSPGTASDGTYLFTSDENHNASTEPDADFYIYDYDGFMVKEVDLTSWWSEPESLELGAQMNGGPNNFCERNGFVFLNCHCNCLNQMVDPVAYLDSEELDDFFVWSNDNGDYVLDHNFEETAALPWVCNDYNVGPYKYSIAADNNLFVAVNAYDRVGAVTFGLMGPDGTGLGYFAFAGETAGWKKGELFVDDDTPFDGMYLDNEQTGGPHYETTPDLLVSGIFFLGHDSISGVITSTTVEIVAFPEETPLRSGERVTVPIYIDMSNSSHSLGEYSLTLKWPSRFLQYVDTAGGTTAGWDVPLLNETITEQGQLLCTCINANGSVGNVNILNVTFDVLGSADDKGVLQLEISSLSAAKTFTDLLPLTQINNYYFTILPGIPKGIWGDINDTNVVNSGDGLIIASYGINIPVGGYEDNVIERGDVNADGLMDITDGLICARYGIQPNYPGLPARVGQLVGSVGKIAAFPVEKSGEIAVPHLSMTSSDENEFIVETSIGTQSSNALIGAATVLIRWDPAAYRFEGIEGGYGNVIANEGHVESGELRMSRIYVYGDVSLAVPNLRMGPLHGGETNLVTAEVLKAVHAETFAEMKITHDQKSIGVRRDDISPAFFELKQNFPNPFNPVTTISYSIAKPSNITLNVYNIQGQKVKTLVDRFESEGIRTVTWDSTDDRGRDVSSGVYIYQLSTPEIREQKQMLLAR